MFTKKRYRLILAFIIPLSFIFSTTTIRGIDSIPFIKPSPTYTPTPTYTPIPTPTATLTPTLTPTPTPSATPIPTHTPSPTPTSLPTPIPISSSEFDNWFNTYSAQYHIDRNTLFLIAVCESNLNTSATNGDYKGIFQFSTGTWISTRRAMGMDQNPDTRLNPEESIRTAAYKIANGGSGAWKNCLP